MGWPPAARWWLRLWPQTSNTLALGRKGERLAAAFLKRQGYRILARNLRNRFGEVDLIAQAPDERTIVIVEVKAGQGGAGAGGGTGGGTGGGGSFQPELHVNTAKQRKLIALGAQIARAHKLQHRPLRFDVIGVDLPNNQTPTMRHHIAAFASHI